MKTSLIRTYNELIAIPDYNDRLEYLKLAGKVGADTFGVDRIFNQQFYLSGEWKSIRAYVISRDHGCELAHRGHPYAKGEEIIVHHMCPIDISDIRDATEYLLDPNYLISMRPDTHRYIHYGHREKYGRFEYSERTPNDTCPWRK